MRSSRLVLLLWALTPALLSMPLTRHMATAAFTSERDKGEMPGTEFKDCANGCPVMVVVPAGIFTMGSPQSQSGEDSEFVQLAPTARERPQHEVTFEEPFAVSKFEVTFEDWDACAFAGACPNATESWGRGRMPVINVSWNDAKAYVAWLSKEAGKDYRLLSESEWEYVARAGTVTRNYWGDNIGKGNAVCDGCGTPWDLRQTAPAGSLKPNAFGLHDIQRNVWEWVEDIWHETYDGAPTDGSAWLQGGDPSIRIIRGAAWRNESDLVRVALRERRNINVRFDTLGFRVARTLSR